MISPSQRPLPDNTQHSQQTNIHVPSGIRTHDLNRRAAVDLRHRPRGYWDRLMGQLFLLINVSSHWCFTALFPKMSEISQFICANTAVVIKIRKDCLQNFTTAVLWPSYLFTADLITLPLAYRVLCQMEGKLKEWCCPCACHEGTGAVHYNISALNISTIAKFIPLPFALWTKKPPQWDPN